MAQYRSRFNSTGRSNSVSGFSSGCACWTAALAGLGVDNGYDPMTAAEARTMAETYTASRWNPVVEALEEIEAAREAEQTANTLPVASINDVAVVEGGMAQFTVSLDKTWNDDVTLTWDTSDGTATDGSDYTGQSGQILTGEQSATLTVQTTGAGDDRITGGEDADRFQILGKAGHDVITDYDPDEGDSILFSDVGFSSYSQMLAHTEQDGDNVVIHTSPGDKAHSLTLLDVQLSDLDEWQFTIVGDPRLLPVVDKVGRWNLLRGKKTTAYKHYKAAYALLADGDEHQEAIAELFGKPQNLPALRLPLPEIDDKLEEEKTTSVLASFDVSRSGRAKNVQLIESEPPDATSARRKAKKTIRGRLYRPRFEKGEPVATVGNKIRIVD